MSSCSAYSNPKWLNSVSVSPASPKHHEMSSWKWRTIWNSLEMIFEVKLQQKRTGTSSGCLGAPGSIFIAGWSAVSRIVSDIYDLKIWWNSMKCDSKALLKPKYLFVFTYEKEDLTFPSVSNVFNLEPDWTCLFSVHACDGPQDFSYTDVINVFDQSKIFSFVFICEQACSIALFPVFKRFQINS